MRQNKSKKFAMWIVGMSFLLSAYAVHHGLEGAAMSFWGAGVPAAAGLYINKQYQDRKWGELEKDKQDGNTN